MKIVALVMVTQVTMVMVMMLFMVLVLELYVPQRLRNPDDFSSGLKTARASVFEDSLLTEVHGFLVHGQLL